MFCRNSCRKSYKEIFKKDLNDIVKTFETIAKGETPSITTGFMSLKDYAKFMQAPHRMDLMVSSMCENGHWHCNQKCLHCYAGHQEYAIKEELETELENIYKGMVAAGSKVIKAKGATFYAIAASTVQLVKALLSDTETILTLATYLDGEYGAKNLCTGVLCKVGGSGLKQIVEVPLPEDEMKLFSEKLASLDNTFEALNVR